MGCRHAWSESFSGWVLQPGCIEGAERLPLRGQPCVMIPLGLVMAGPWGGVLLRNETVRALEIVAGRPQTLAVVDAEIPVDQHDVSQYRDVRKRPSLLA